MIQDVTSLLNQIKIDRDIFQKSRLLEYLIKEKNFRIIDLANKIGYKSSYILGENYTVKQTEVAVREYLYQIKSVGKYINKESTEKLTQKIREKYPELNIQIIQTRIKGKVILEVKGDLEKSSKILKQILEKLYN